MKSYTMDKKIMCVTALPGESFFGCFVTLEGSGVM